MGKFVGIKMTVLSLAVLVCISSVQAQQSADQFYEGKAVSLLVGYSPGGGYDTYAQQVMGRPFVAPRMM